MTPSQMAADAAGEALAAYRSALGRYGVAGSDGWLLGYLRTACARPDQELAAIVRALLWLRDERGQR